MTMVLEGRVELGLLVAPLGVLALHHPNQTGIAVSSVGPRLEPPVEAAVFSEPSDLQMTKWRSMARGPEVVEFLLLSPMSAVSRTLGIRERDLS
jgi:hypothetical protein